MSICNCNFDPDDALWLDHATEWGTAMTNSSPIVDEIFLHAILHNDMCFAYMLRRRNLFEDFVKLITSQSTTLLPGVVCGIKHKIVSLLAIASGTFQTTGAAEIDTCVKIYILQQIRNSEELDCLWFHLIETHIGKHDNVKRLVDDVPIFSKLVKFTRPYWQKSARALTKHLITWLILLSGYVLSDNYLRYEQDIDRSKLSESTKSRFKTLVENPRSVHWPMIADLLVIIYEHSEEETRVVCLDSEVFELIYVWLTKQQIIHQWQHGHDLAARVTDWSPISNCVVSQSNSVYFSVRVRLLRNQFYYNMWKLGTKLQPLGLSLLVMLGVVDSLMPNCEPMHAKWRVLQYIKHAKKRR